MAAELTIEQTSKLIDTVARTSSHAARDIALSTRFADDLGLDPQGLDKLYGRVQSEFGVTLADAQAGRLRTVGDLAEAIAGKL
ncbi:acyl carrier protein [Kitasatospora sp. NPDC052896]|uniref:acyl carrier protein n=1 Tax=Kitasatospora sp. NPDC052896 TaxID=3364061 RepID=UPI0037CB98C3